MYFPKVDCVPNFACKTLISFSIINLCYIESQLISFSRMGRIKNQMLSN